MATRLENPRRAMRCAAFRSTATGEVIETGAFHDILRLPGAYEADLDLWEAGFVDHGGCFHDRAAAAAAAGVCGRLEARAHFAGAPEPTLEAGRLESWRRAPVRRAA